MHAEDCVGNTSVSYVRTRLGLRERNTYRVVVGPAVVELDVRPVAAAGERRSPQALDDRLVVECEGEAPLQLQELAVGDGAVAARGVLVWRRLLRRAVVEVDVEHLVGRFRNFVLQISFVRKYRGFGLCRGKLKEGPAVRFLGSRGVYFAFFVSQWGTPAGLICDVIG
jgi:hypothetical protein